MKVDRSKGVTGRTESRGRESQEGRTAGSPDWRLNRPSPYLGPLSPVTRDSCHLQEGLGWWPGHDTGVVPEAPVRVRPQTIPSLPRRVEASDTHTRPHACVPKKGFGSAGRRPWFGTSRAFGGALKGGSGV